MSATPFTLQSILSLPGTPGLAVEPIAFQMSAGYDSKAEFEYNLPATPGSKDVDFGTMPAEGAKAYFLYYEPGGTAPVAVTINGGSAPQELTPGGFIAFASPSPAAGITSMSIAYTAAGKVRVWLLG